MSSKLALNISTKFKGIVCNPANKDTRILITESRNISTRTSMHQAKMSSTSMA